MSSKGDEHRNFARDSKEARSAGQQIVDVDRAKYGERYRHGGQDDGQDEVEQENSECCKEAELEGCACADLNFFRCRRRTSCSRADATVGTAR